MGVDQNPGDIAIRLREEELNELTELVIGCAFTVLNTLGCGFLEKVYENALVHELRKRGLEVEPQHEIPVYYDGVVVGQFFADILVEKKVIVELKAAKDDNEIFVAQCLNYLKATGLPICLLLNFGKPRLDIKRLRGSSHLILNPHCLICVHLCSSVANYDSLICPERFPRGSLKKEQSVARDKLVLAYSGGLDTSVAVKWINETYDMDVIAYTCDLGQGQDIQAIRQKALRTGAVDAIAEDARNLFIDYFVWPSLMAGALYEGKYPLATALGRPLIAQLMVRVAREHGAVAVAHGCTGKGNDQVRFDVTFQTLAPDLKIVAPVREWKWTRTQELEFAAKHGIEVEATKKSIFSTDQNLWGRSIEAGILEDPWVEPPPETFQWTADPRQAPDDPEEVEITFDHGKPVALNGQEKDGIELIDDLNRLAGKHGVGRIDHIENRLVGIKSREIYEAPAAVLLHEAHREVEFLTLSKESLRFKTLVSQAYADLIYNGLWFSQLHQDLMAFTVSNQQYVSGTARIKLYKGHAQIVGRKSPHSLYRHELATYEEGDQYDSSAAMGFIKIHGLGQTTQAKHQLLKGKSGPRLELPSIIPPDRAR